MNDIPESFNLARWLLEPNLEQRPDKVAVRFEDREWTYRRVAEETSRVQGAFEALGLQPEQRVLMVLPDVPEFVSTWLAVVRGGFVFAMVNPRLPTEDYSYYLEYSRAPVAVVHADALEAFAPAARSARFLRRVIVVGAAGEADLGVSSEPYAEAVTAAPVEAFDTHRDDLCGWLFTSGTSGKPKAAVHFHQDFRFNIDRYAKQVLALREDDVTMAVSKLFFGYATGTNLMFPFAVGGSTALFSERSTAEAVVRRVAQFRPSMLAAVPTTLAGILSLDEGAVDEAMSSLRMILSAGEALPKDLLERFDQRFGVEILDGIGSAEMFHIYVSNYPGDVRPGSLGRLVPGYETRIVGPDGQDVPSGEDGVMWVRGGSTALGYWQDRAKSRATFQGDWTITGDLFRCDERGYYWYQGRADDMLKVGGIWVAPREVEECLSRHPEVRECCVVGRAGRDGLVTPMAFVVLREGAAAPEARADVLVGELQEFVKTSLAPYKYPRRVEFVEELPRNDRGKVARAELKRRAQALSEDGSGDASRAERTAR